MLQDSVKGHWSAWLPTKTQPYVQLMRLDRPIGWWLLLLPCWWSLTLAKSTNPLHYIYMLIGAIVMRGAGCVWNDWLDRDLDKLVERTKNRPLPSGRLSSKQALLFLSLLLLIGLVILLQFNRFAVYTGLASLLVVAIYPLMKRVTYLPQFFLGLAFSWGAFMGFAVEQHALPLSAFTLYLASILWVIGYDTIYAHQDSRDDAIVNIKSSARLFAENTKLWLVFLYGGAVILLALTLFLLNAKMLHYGVLAIFAAHLTWQITALDIKSPENCLKLFRSNRDAGLILAIGWLQ